MLFKNVVNVSRNTAGQRCQSNEISHQNMFYIQTPHVYPITEFRIPTTYASEVAHFCSEIFFSIPIALCFSYNLFLLLHTQIHEQNI